MPVCLGPVPVENELAVRVEFEIQRHSAHEASAIIPADDMPRDPAGVFADTVMSFQSRQEFVAEKRVMIGYERVPLGCGCFGQGVEAINAHDP